MTAVLKIKGDRYYAVINYKEGCEYKQKWIALGIPTKNNKRKAESMLDEIKKQYADGYDTPCGDMLFTTYIKQWLQHKRDCVEMSTWEGYKIYAERHIIPYFDKLKLSLRDLKPKHIQEYYQYKYTSGRLDGRGGGLSIPSIKKHSIVIRQVLDDAVMAELLNRNPASSVKMPAKNITTREMKFLTKDTANQMLKAFDGHRLQALVYTTLYYGLRRSEVLGLRWSAIDFEKNTMTINHTVVKNLTIVSKDAVKTQSSFHTYTLIDDVKTVLLREYQKQQESAHKLGRGYKNPEGYVFTWENGKLFRPDYITKAFQNVLAKNNLPIMRFHDLRHSTASILYDKGWDIKDIQSWLRHSDIQTTGNIYTHITEDRKSKMANELNSTFKI